MEDPPSSPPADLHDPVRAIAYYKAQYESLEQELQEFQASSLELEKELERDVEAAEERERRLLEKQDGLQFEVDEWKVSVGNSIHSSGHG